MVGTRYGLFPGLLIGLQRDLSEPLAFGLVALRCTCSTSAAGVGIAAAAVFGLAGLVRETTLVFPCYSDLVVTGRPNALAGATCGSAEGCSPPSSFALHAWPPAAAWAGARWGWLGRSATPKEG